MGAPDDFDFSFLLLLTEEEEEDEEKNFPFPDLAVAASSETWDFAQHPQMNEKRAIDRSMLLLK